ncbi:HAD-like domain-containing protein [Panaeolus papilionaceus]|nr:HAD-like domain-containing protein [Panaeolus papilionaceus]
MHQIKVLVFDVFGTVVDWRSSVISQLQEAGQKHGIFPDSTNWKKFAEQWRSSYMKNTRRIAIAGGGSCNVDVMHREILDEMLNQQEWAHIGRAWDENTRADITLAWHRLKGWPDTLEGLHELKKDYILATLSNGNVRLLVDMAKYAGLPWDMIFSTELFDTFKPNPKAYLETMRHLGVTDPSECAMVAAHIYDLRAAATVGMATVYIPRPEEDSAAELGQGGVKSKKDGGEVDYIVKSFVELANTLRDASA